MLLTLKNLLVNPSELADHGDLVRERIASHEIIMVLMIEQRNSCLQPFLLLWGAAVLRTHYSEPIYPPNFLFSRSSPPGPPILLSFHVHTHVSAFSSCLSFLNWLWFLVLQEGVQSSLSRLLLNEGWTYAIGQDRVKLRLPSPLKRNESCECIFNYILFKKKRTNYLFKKKAYCSPQ